MEPTQKDLVLYHYSAEPFIFDKKEQYQVTGHNPLKPHGLWLSDDNENGWKEWCLSNEFHTNSLKYKTAFEIIDQTALCNLSSVIEVIQFISVYSEILYGSFKTINWEKVKQAYSGILISPYSHSFDLRFGQIWYNSWDCASACIWDLSILKECIE